MIEPGTKPLREVDKIERNADGSATLTLACGHKQVVEDFPEGMPPLCFRRYCEVEGCANA
jgi:hypothetical protein